jgi:hypothetical protein
VAAVTEKDEVKARSDGESRFENPGRQSGEKYMNAPIFTGTWGSCHIQGIALDPQGGYVYYSFTTKLIKSDLDGNILAQTAIEKADQIIRLSSPDLKSMSFYLSQLSLYSDSKYRLDEHIHGINTPNVDVFMPIEEAKAQLGEVSFTLPFCRTVKEQMQQGKLHVRTSDKRFESRMQDIASQVVAYGTD